MVDDKDLLIIDTLKANAKASVIQIAKETGLPSTTVHNRIKKLRKEGIIAGYTIKVDNKKLGKDIAAFIAITVDYKLLKAQKISQYGLAEKIGKMPFAEEASMITGLSDILVKVRFKSIDELNNFVTKELRNLEGVEKTQTMVILNEVID